MSYPPGDVKDKTKQYNINRIRPRAAGKDRKTKSHQKHLRGSRSSLWLRVMTLQIKVCGTSSIIGRFYERSRSGTLLPCLPSPTCFRQPRFQYDRDKTNDRVMTWERGGLVRGSDPPSCDRVHNTAGYTRWAPARRLIQKHLSTGV